MAARMYGDAVAPGCCSKCVYDLMCDPSDSSRLCIIARIHFVLMEAAAVAGGGNLLNAVIFCRPQPSAFD